MASTADNLKEAFEGESKASTTYLAFARKAEQEGYTQVAKLFRAAAAAEVVHARNHLEAMEGVRSTEENLKSAIAGENMEHVNMYPEFIDQAKKEGKTKAERTFEWARQVEIIHESLYKAALSNGVKSEGEDYLICQVCGMTVEGAAPERCPVCGAPAKSFTKIN